MARVQLLEHFQRTTVGVQLVDYALSYLVGLGARPRPSGWATPLTLAHDQRSLVVYLPQNCATRDALGAMRAQQTAAKRDELGICAQVSLRYEMPYLLPWLAYHTLLGFDRILLYLDDLSHLGLIDAGEQGHVLKTLARASHVTVLRMSAHNMTGPGDQMQHCVWSARKHAVYAMFCQTFLDFWTSVWSRYSRFRTLSSPRLDSRRSSYW